MIGVRPLFHSAALGLLAAAAAQPTSAAIVTFTDRAAFTAEAGAPLATETFNSFTADASFLTPLDIGDFTISTEATVATAGSEPTNQIDITPFSFDENSIDGSTFGQAFLRRGEALTFTFDAPISAFGIDTGFLGNTGLETSFKVDGQLFTPDQDGLSLIFTGVTSDAAFSAVSLIFEPGTGPSPIADGFSFDNVAYSPAAVVPVPASLPLLIGAVGALGWLGRRRRARRIV